MFGKLLKYDFRSMLKQFAFIWPAALVLAIINRFTLSGLDSSNSVGETTAGIAMLVYVAILMTMFIIAVIFTIQRFYKGLLGDEGYLMHTLPVKSWQLIGSKLACAVFATAANVAVAVVSVLLILPWGREDLAEVFRLFGYLFSHWDLQATQVVICMLEAVLFALVSFATGYLQLYLAMAIGHLANKNRVAMSVAAFIGLNVIMNILTINLGEPVLDFISPVINDLHGMAGYSAAIWTAIAGELVFCVAYFAGTNYILHNRLNLE